MKMHAIRLGGTMLAGLLLATPAWAVPAPDDATKESAAEKLRRALDQVITVEFQELSLPATIDKLREQTKLNIVLDRAGITNPNFQPNGAFPPGFVQPGVPQPGLPQFNGNPNGGVNFHEMRVDLKLKDAKIRTVLTQMANQLNLTYVLEREVIVITSRENAPFRMMNLRVTVDLDKVPLETALKQLAVETGVNLVIDPRHIQKGKEPVSLKVDEVPLEAALKLLTEMVNLRVVRVSNVVWITTEEGAAKMLWEQTNPGQPFPGVPGMGVPGGANGFAPMFVPPPIAPLRGANGMLPPLKAATGVVRN